DRGDPTANPSVDLDLLGCEITPEVFPVALRELRGRVLLRGRDLAFDRVTARHGDAPISASGEARALGGGASVHVEGRAPSAGRDAERRRALGMEPEGADVLAALEPGGRFSVVARVDLEPGWKEAHRTLDLELEDFTTVFRGFVDESGARRGFPLRV